MRWCQVGFSALNMLSKYLFNLISQWLKHWTIRLRPKCPSRGICTRTDSVTMSGHSSSRMLYSSMMKARKMLAELRSWHATPSCWSNKHPSDHGYEIHPSLVSLPVNL
ncbi:hypothetical protein Ccrd_020399 [Cynara cardunculus var. scolymus]|uniref:Uncharacterized protein n=1 Tax=Cynara cardunculus var. scolymus TaxID=59895 RepID=A0A124SEW3_CYNCS|nr:hypothetical protein Ccrd_020399 [Cynara cardunculus var. scolymus]